MVKVLVEYMRKVSPNYLIRAFIEGNIYFFTPDLASFIFNLEKERIYNMVKTLKRRELILEAEKGKYFVIGHDPKKVLSNPFFIGNKLANPSYVSFWNALNYHGLTEQVPKKIFLVSSKRKNPTEVQGYKFQYVRLKPSRFFGYESKGGELSFLIADEEKSLVDSLLLPQYAGGVEEIYKCLENSDLDVEKAEKYALKMGNKSLCSRLGYLMERADLETTSLEENVPKSYVKLDPSREKSGEREKKWNLYVNWSG